MRLGGVQVPKWLRVHSTTLAGRTQQTSQPRANQSFELKMSESESPRRPRDDQEAASSEKEREEQAENMKRDLGRDN